MPVKRLYLTIDDAPSKHMKAKVDFLVENNIPAVFYADGDAYEQALSKYWEEGTKEDPILLLHDFDRNHHLFERTMAFLLSKKIEFLSIISN